MPSPASKPYDDVLYPDHAYQYTHPDRLAVMGALFGLRPAPVERCRVLELGCGAGGNIIPLAYTLPGSEFVGIDLAANPIALGTATAAALGLSNLRLEAMDVLDFPATEGPFDYIIVHGLYSWVPPVVREKILAICGTQLSPHGIAYVSYKTYPGSYITETIHEMMRYQARRRPGATEEEITLAGVEMLRLVVKSKPESDPYRGPLAWRLGVIERYLQEPDGYAWVYYDLGVEISEAFYFRDFVAHSARHGLQYLSEVALELPNLPRFGPEVTRALDGLGDDVIAREQYLDFLIHTEFRRSLLCRADVVLDRSLSPARAYPLYASSPLKPAVDTPAEASDAEEQFLSPGGGKVTVSHPTAKAALRRLWQTWPGTISFADLLAACAPVTGGEDSVRQRDADGLADVLLGGFRANLLELTTRAQRWPLAVSERPVASLLLRQQLDSGRDVITSLRHLEIKIEDAVVRRLLQLLDGTRDRAALRRDLKSWLETARAADPALPPPDWVDANLEKALLSFVRQQFLVA